MISGNGFDNPHRGGTHGDNTPAPIAGLPDRARGQFINFESLFMHYVLGDRSGFHRRKSSQTHVQCDEARFHTSAVAGIEKLRSEMESGSRRRYRTRDPAKNCLIAVQIFGALSRNCALDVRRERNFANAFELFSNIVSAVESKATVTGVIDRDDFCLDGFGASVDEDSCSNSRFFAWPDQGPPIIRPVFFEEQQFKHSMCFRIHSPQSGWNDSRVIEDQNISRREEFGQGTKGLVRNAAARSPQHQQARLIPFGGGVLSN